MSPPRPSLLLRRYLRIPGGKKSSPPLATFPAPTASPHASSTARRIVGKNALYPTRSSRNPSSRYSAGPPSLGVLEQISVHVHERMVWRRRAVRRREFVGAVELVPHRGFLRGPVDGDEEDLEGPRVRFFSGGASTTRLDHSAKFATMVSGGVPQLRSLEPQ